ncbi:intracellular protein transport protein USO1-like [Senna tora]|uniref:Intracellular protein transport protein USO1-like n=1 Tax=Senna tora TaxID=362788 RepID=A0A834WMC7_9FABA|nr:intracellular protein transport protein USO1-like [Senna tora]
MFRSTRWRSDKQRIKAIFKLHFHATLVLQSGVDALALSIIPGDIGRPTTRLENATVRDGVCRWENPVYETVKFIQEPKTGKINERIYYFVVSTGLSKASSIGEVSINFADFAKATKSSSVSLPIKNSRCGAVLHVSIQRLQENCDQSRMEEESEDVKIESHERGLNTYLSNGDTEERNKMNSVEGVSADAIIRRVELSADCRTSSESDITLSSSDGSSGLDTPRQLGSKNTNNIHHNPNASTLTTPMYERSHWDWSAGSDNGLSTENSPNGSHHDALPLEMSQQASDLEIERLKAELTTLARQVDVSDLELQTLRKQIVKESKRGQELSKEIFSLKEERDALKAECDNLRSFHKRMDEAKVRNRSQLEGGDLRTLVEEIRQELSYEKDLNANLRLQLKKTQESNAELVLAVQDLDQMLEQKNVEIYNLTHKDQNKNSQELRGNLSKYDTDNDEEQKELEEIVKEHSNSKDSQLLEQKITELYGEIDMYKRDKDELEMHMEQLALDYEILKQENHEIAYKLEQSQLQEQLKQYECSSTADAVNDLEAHIESLENELKKQSQEFSDSLATIKKLESHIKRLEEDIEEQARGFETDLESVTHDKVEQEKRAIRAEEALRKARLKSASAAERLQEEFRRLSIQLASMFDANEKASMKAIAEASELRAEKSLLEEMLQKVREELQSVKDNYEVKLSELSNQIESMAVQIQQTLMEIEEKSKELEKQKNHEEQIHREFSEEKQILEAENKRLNGKVIYFSEQAEQKESLRIELEVTKKSVEELETLLQRGRVERNELVSTIALLKREAEKILEELNGMKHVKDEKETMARLLQSELETVRDECNNLKRSLLEDEAEKQKLRKQIFQLKGELKKKEDALTNMEKKFKDTNGHQQLSTIAKNKKSASIPLNSKEIASLREKIKMLEEQIKSKETASEASKNLFMQKEKELQNKIEELESRVAEFNQSSALQKVAEDQSIINSTSGVRDTAEHLNDATCLDIKFSDKEAKISIVDKGNGNVSDMLTELATLKERNQSMESELKEMQERYTEISLRFAEVEGERQKLVMTVRNLRIAQKVK